MSNLSRLLILSASYGEGHQQAAYAVRDALSVVSPHTDVEIVDYLRTVHPVLDSVARYCYLKSVQFAPLLYAMFYKGTMQIPPSSLIQRQLNSLGINELEEKLQTYRPDVVLATFPTPAGVVSYLKQQGRVNVPLATVITDHAVHSQWIHPGTNRYFVGSEYVRRGLINRGIDSDAVRVTGIPVRPAFLQNFDKAALYRKYQLDENVPTLLVMGGAYGVMGDINQICEELFQYPHPLQVIVVAGRNERMRAQLDVSVRQAATPSRVYGFVSEVYELMALADLMLTKAGGLTISEALAMQLPMLLYRPIPGQEIQNTRFLVSSGVAVLARNRREVFDRIEELMIRNPRKRHLMRERALRVRKLHAAEEITQGILEISNLSETRVHYSYHR